MIYSVWGPVWGAPIHFLTYSEEIWLGIFHIWVFKILWFSANLSPMPKYIKLWKTFQIYTKEDGYYIFFSENAYILPLKNCERKDDAILWSSRVSLIADGWWKRPSRLLRGEDTQWHGWSFESHQGLQGIVSELHNPKWKAAAFKINFWDNGSVGFNLQPRNTGLIPRFIKVQGNLLSRNFKIFTLWVAELRQTMGCFIQSKEPKDKRNRNLGEV